MPWNGVTCEECFSDIGGQTQCAQSPRRATEYDGHKYITTDYGGVSDNSFIRVVFERVVLSTILVWIWFWFWLGIGNGI